MSSSSHGAAASAVGYLYQVKWALLEVLRAAHDRPDQAISLEKLEDVAWERQGDPVQLLQLKHHHASAGRIGDKDGDVWRTLSAWLDVPLAAGADPPDLYLITTQISAERSALEALRPPNRDPAYAEQRLIEAAQTSRSQGTENIRRRFLDLPVEERGRFVARIYVIDAAPRAEDVDNLVRQALLFALPRGHESRFLDLVWAWWYSVSLDMLQGRRSSVRATEVTARVSDLRDDFSHDNLPTLVTAPNREDEAALAAVHSDQVFVHQMRWVHAPDRILEKAIVDYYRAVAHTRLWLEDDLIGLHELGEFERRLRDEWERELAWRMSELPPDADEEAKATLGRELLRSILDQTAIRVRERYDEPFFARGKYHELADSGRVGWHPDFANRLAELLLNHAS